MAKTVLKGLADVPMLPTALRPPLIIADDPLSELTVSDPFVDKLLDPELVKFLITVPVIWYVVLPLTTGTVLHGSPWQTLPRHYSPKLPVPRPAGIRLSHSRSRLQHKSMVLESGL